MKKINILWLATVLILTGVVSSKGADSTPPNVPKEKAMAPDFTLKTLAGEAVSLKGLNARGPVVLVVLRGWPGYQCPICTRQVQEFLGQADRFKAQNAQVLMVYPGPAKDLEKHAEEFLGNKEWPSHFTYVTDPDYAFTQAYGLRWEAPKETAYPSTFVIDGKGTIRLAKVSAGHGDRLSAKAALDALKSE